MKRNIVLMAKSKKGNDGYCVAGIDTATGEWIRLNIAGEYSFPRHLLCYKDGRAINVLDTFSIEITSNDDRFQNQPENFFCIPTTIEHANKPIEEVISKRIEEDRNCRDYVFL